MTIDQLVICAGILVILFAVFRKLLGPKPLGPESSTRMASRIVTDNFQLAWLDSRFQSLANQFGIPIANDGENKLQHQAHSFASLTMNQTIKRHKQGGQLSRNDLFCLFLVGFVASDYISDVIQQSFKNLDVSEETSFEIVSLISCSAIGIQQKFAADDVDVLIREVGDEYNRLMSAHNGFKILKGLGGHIDQFFRTGEEQQLDSVVRYYAQLKATLIEENVLG